MVIFPQNVSLMESMLIHPTIRMHFDLICQPIFYIIYKTWTLDIDNKTLPPTNIIIYYIPQILLGNIWILLMTMGSLYWEEFNYLKFLIFMLLWTLLLQIVGIRLEWCLLLSEIYVNTYSFKY